MADCGILAAIGQCPVWILHETNENLSPAHQETEQCSISSVGALPAAKACRFRLATPENGAFLVTNRRFSGLCKSTFEFQIGLKYMCRFVYYRGAAIRLSSLITEPVHSIIHQSYHSKEREEPLNGDGFGVGWYAPEETDRPVVFKDVTPAWNNQNLANLAPVVRSPCIVAHIRAATPGLPVSQLNCHPFSWGKFAFAHNGEVGGFRAIRRQIQSELSEEAFNLLRGSTDSEHLFALFANNFGHYSGSSTLDAMASALGDAITTVEALKNEQGIDTASMLNVVLTDGESAVVTRYASSGQQKPHSLYLHQGSAYECVDGVCHMRDRSESGNTVLVASEPLSHDDGWKRVDANCMLLIDKEFVIEQRPIDIHSR